VYFTTHRLGQFDNDFSVESPAGQEKENYVTEAIKPQDS
jgi:hypothetical protein